MGILKALVCVTVCSAMMSHGVAYDVELNADEELNEKYLLLAKLTPRKDELPENCKVVQFPPDIKQFQGLKNQTITTDSKFFILFANELRRIINVKSVDACYISYYQEKGELGLIGWAFKSEEEATRAHKAVAEAFAREPERFRLWRERETVVWLWRDPKTTDQCFERFEKFVEARVDTESRQIRP